MHIAKYQNLGLISHYSRERREVSENIDRSRSHLNYNISMNDSSIEDATALLDKIAPQRRSNAVVMCDCVLTMPSDVPASREREFFKLSYDFLEMKFGNSFSSYVHKDESRPHMHYCFAPIDDRGKLCAKNLINRSCLRTLHTELEKYLDERGLHCSILNEATREGNKSVQELKRLTAMEKIQDELSMCFRSKIKAEKAREAIKTSIRSDLAEMKRDDAILLQELRQDLQILADKVVEVEQRMEAYKDMEKRLDDMDEYDR